MKLKTANIILSPVTATQRITAKPSVPIALALSEDGIIDSGNMRETNFLAWTSQVQKVTSSKISDFEIDGITFEVGGNNKKGKQIKVAEVGYLVKDDMEFAAGHSIPIWMFGFIY